ncbi:outer membrane lipid asymmetry maintenance protein MlaD [Lysobacter humi (ex Lee et al. 2017)]
MRSPRIEFAVGAFLLLALATLLVLAIASTNGRWGQGGDGYVVKARFSNIGGLRPNAPVKIGGVAIGRVADIQLDPKKLDALVQIEIEGNYRDLPSDTAAGIFTAGLLGESFIGLTPGGDPEPLKPGDEIYLTQPAVDLLQLVGKYMFSGAGKSDEDAPASEGEAAAPTE